MSVHIRPLGKKCRAASPYRMSISVQAIDEDDAVTVSFAQNMGSAKIAFEKKRWITCKGFKNHHSVGSLAALTREVVS